jgi:AAA+ superfamily predicted ATPase
MEKLFEHNLGLSSRFQKRLVFADYTDSELLQIFLDLFEHEDKCITTPTKLAKPVSMQSSSGNSYYDGRVARASGTEGELRKDSHGNEWKFSQSPQGVPEWRDVNGNLCNYDLYQIGANNNPVIDKNGGRWTYEAASSTWKASSGMSQKHYPGSPFPNLSKKERRNKPYHCKEPKWPRVAITRLGRRRHVLGFGNARAVRTLFDLTLERQASRLVEMDENKDVDHFLFTREDLLGPTIDLNSLSKSVAWKDLNGMVGLQPVKKHIQQLFMLVENNTKREERDKPIQEIVLNRIFLGNPGTGKTTAAKLYGKILSELGLLTKGEMIFKTASDFKGDVLGASETKTREILKSAEGCVLVIDEAYSLCSGGGNGMSSADPYGAAVIDTIVEQVQARPGDDRAVVMLGYREEMQQMLKNANPGLARRFQLENAFDFPDMGDEDLIKVLFSKTKKEGLEISLRTAKLAIRELAKARAKPNFGNAGAVDNLLSAAKGKLQVRSSSSMVNELILADFGIEREGPDTDLIASLFDDLVGCEEIKLKMENLLKTVQFARSAKRPLHEVVEYNWLFMGNPGTGKTTVARRMGKMFKALGVLPNDEVKEVSMSDLLTGYVGQAGKRTRELITQVPLEIALAWISISLAQF